MQTARTLTFTAPRRVEIRTEPLPTLGPGEARVKTVVSAISAGTEMLVYRGQAPAELAADETISALAGSLAYPLRYGYSAVGRVVEIGPGVDAGWEDAIVFSFQPHADAFNAAVETLIRIPDGISPDDAVFLANVETALGLVMDGAPLAGERVAVLGQGVVGLLTAAILASFPLERLMVLDRFPDRLALAKRFSGAETLAPGELPEGTRHDFDLVFELSGAPEALDDAIGLAGVEGRIVAGSWYGTKRAAVDLGGHFHRGRLRLISSQVSRLAPALTGRWTKPRRMAYAVSLLNRLQPSQLITHRFSLDRTGEAYALIDERPGDAVQVVFDY